MNPYFFFRTLTQQSKIWWAGGWISSALIYPSKGPRAALGNAFMLLPSPQLSSSLTFYHTQENM